MDGGEEFAQALTDMVEQVWKAKGMPEELISKPVTAHYARQLWNGVTEGYGTIAEKFNLGIIDYTTPDFDKLAALQSNTWTFSSAKNYTQLRQLSQALIGDDGKLRNYRSFKEAAMLINDTHKNQYLKAEYNLAVAGGQMASKWVQIKENEATLPMLEFDAVMDRRTSDICRPLNGTVLPVSDPFWSMYYPPNHFGCRSTVRQRAGRAATPHHDVPSAEIPPMFRTNLAEHGLIFPKGHAYFVDLPENVNDVSFLRNEMRDIAIERLKGKIVEVDKIGSVHITKSGIKKCIAQKLSPEFYSFKNQLVPFSNRLLENAYNIKEELNRTNNGLKVWKAKVKGLNNFNVVIKEEKHDGKIINVLYSITAHK